MMRIANGRVYDPQNGVNGEVRDLWIEGGRIVAPTQEAADRVVDATGLVVLPGGVDIHSHIAGPKVNAARRLRPEDHRRNVRARTAFLRAGSGYTVPSTFLTGYRYAELGYTTVMEAAVAPLAARHAHAELNDIPVIDKGCYVTMGNNHFVMECIRRGRTEELRDYVAWLLSAAKAYAVKLVNPGGVENWKCGRNSTGLDDRVTGFNVTPRQIIRALAQANEDLGLPHSIHLHTNCLGQVGNYRTTVRTIEALEGRRGHICHIQFSSYGDAAGKGFRSGAAEVAEAVNQHRNVTVDVGQVIFGEATTMSSDAPLEYELHRLTGAKWLSQDVEEESGGGVVPLVYRREDLFSALQWAIGLELFLLIEDPWRVMLTTDHPNGGPFTSYPQVIRLLMDRGYREEMLSRAHRRVGAYALLPQIGREYSLYEIAIVTRAAPARALGLHNKGHLGPGADADVAIYAPMADAEAMFSRPRYVIKGGRVVVEDGVVVADCAGRTFYAGPEWSPGLEPEIRAYFERAYTVTMENYAVDLGSLRQSERVPCR